MPMLGAPRKRPGISPGPSAFRLRVGLIVHATAGHSWGPTVLLRPFGDHGFRGDQEAGNRRRALDRRTHDLGRVDDALGDEIAVLASLRVEAPVVLILLEDLADNDRAVFAGIGRNLARRSLDRLADDVDAVLLVFVGRAHLLEGLGGAH